ncbi:restriction endonuclease subunit S [Fibrobacter sp. UWH1]|uniref:restriction endonuclease subunit S n=1 Tax=Fibrobacter sp. UWH1 TaxID=1964354 RepID=UPI000B524D0B|nr:restriction endonuclease subunit S [Fibrobacter sp. UWH1]OWV15393.1 hypothetical protein B7992_04920 [Fibrobacter sp. UWH1]
MTPEIEKRIKLVKAGKVPAGYKRTKIGIVPKEWQTVLLGTLFSDRNESNCSSMELLSITADKGIIPRSEIEGKDNSSEDKSKYKRVYVGDIAYNTMRMWQGVSALSLYEGIVSPAYTVLNPIKSICVPYFSYLFKMKSLINCFYRNSQGLVDDTRSLKYEWFKKIEVDTPSKREQEKIAEILAAQDRVIELKENLIAEKQTQKNYLMDQLFSGQKRLVGKTESFVSSAIGSVPSDWKLFLFETLFDVCKEHTENLIEYPLYSLTIENGVTPKTERYERQHLVKKENVYKILKPKYFAYNPMNIRFGAIGLHKKEFPVAVSGYYDTFTCKDPSILIFMEHFLKSDAMLNYYDKVSTGSLIEKKRVHLSQFLSFELPLPSIEEMRAIAKVLSTADEEISLLQKDLEQEKLKKKSLMQLLLTGLVRVSA